MRGERGGYWASAGSIADSVLAAPTPCDFGFFIKSSREKGPLSSAPALTSSKDSSNATVPQCETDTLRVELVATTIGAWCLKWIVEGEYL